jgi:endoglucanase
VNDTLLYGWKWGKRDDGTWGMIDNNNATDGDMWIAYSLILAYEMWGDLRFLDEAKTMIQALKEHTIYQYKDKLLLLPSQYGFVKEDHIKLNPSYTIPFIFDKFLEYDPDKVWEKLVIDSFDMFRRSAVGNLKLHPDWIKLNLNSGKCEHYGDESIFGFDSIRTPLFLGYQYKLKKDDEVKSLLRGYRVFMEYIKKLDKYIYQIDFQNHKIRFRYPPYGFLVVYQYLYNLFGIAPPPSLKTKIEEGIENEENNYYSFSLLLFTDILN